MNIFEMVAEQNGVSTTEVETEIQFIIDDLWDHPESDTEEFKRLRLVFGQKPSIEEFVEYLAVLVQSAG